MAEIYVSFKIVSDNLTPEDIEESTGLTCDYKWRIGDKRGKTIIIEKTNGIVLESNLQPETPLQDQITALLERLEPYDSAISNLPRETYRELGCVIYSEERPDLFFSAVIVNKISKMNACFGIDYYSFDP